MQDPSRNWMGLIEKLPEGVGLGVAHEVISNF